MTSPYGQRPQDNQGPWPQQPTFAPVAPPPRKRTGMIVGVAVAAVVVLAGIVAGVVFAVTRLTDTPADPATAQAHAEQVAGDYAVGAATVDYRDLDAWKRRLTTDVAPELQTRYNSVVPAMKNLFVSLRMVSTAQPHLTKVTAEKTGVYTVEAQVDVAATSIQSPSATTKLEIYVIDVDSNRNWLITDVRGDPVGA